MEENASKALMMTTSIIIGILIVSTGVFVFNIFTRFSKEREEELFSSQIEQFNQVFTKFQSLDVINIHDIIEVANYAKDYNTSLYNKDHSVDTNYYIRVNIKNVAYNVQDMDMSDKVGLIDRYMDINFKLKDVDGIKYDNGTGRVKSITFEINYTPKGTKVEIDPR